MGVTGSAGQLCAAPPSSSITTSALRLSHMDRSFLSALLSRKWLYFGILTGLSAADYSEPVSDCQCVL